MVIQVSNLKRQYEPPIQVGNLKHQFEVPIQDARMNECGGIHHFYTLCAIISPMIDIRSDTVTQPTAKMREAMAQAVVGDDVYEDDPTVQELEHYGAGLVGKEAALFVPSGTFGNQLALFTWCPRGSEIILGEECHIIQHEVGAASIIAGVQTRTISAPDGYLDPSKVEERIRGQDIHFPITSLICIENAHSSGRVVSCENLQDIRNLANRYKLPVHLDGARIFNAACTLGVSARKIAQFADSVMFCLSKGLCAPVGSLLAGPKSFIELARKKRKIMGGGMRQVGVLAAAGLVALKEMVGRLSEDHKRARTLAAALAQIPSVEIDPSKVDINMVFFSITGKLLQEDPAYWVQRFREEGICINPPEQGVFRFVTHYWVDDAAIDHISKASKKIFSSTAIV